MQSLTASPRDTLTEAQILALLYSDSLTVTAGLELLDSDDMVVSDISDDLAGGEVDRDCLANVHGTCRLQVSQALAWGTARVRPYMTLTANSVTARWNLGVYVLTTPDRPVGESPETYNVAGYDKLYLLQNPIGDTYSVPAGADVLTAVRDVITASEAGGAVLLDGSASGKTLPADMTWPLTSSEQHTYLNVVNDLLAAVGYRGMWCDQDGAFRSEPYRNPTDRAIEATFTADDPLTSLVGVSRTQTQDVWGRPNWWRFIQNSLDDPPAEGAGQYTVENVSDGLSSQDSLGYVRRKVVFLDAADQASLEAQGDQTVAADKQVITTLKVTTGPWPGAGHFDVYSYTDSTLGGVLKVQATSWQMPLDGSDVTWTWTQV